MNQMNKILRLILIIIIIILALYTIYEVFTIRDIFNLSIIPDVNWPFINLIDENGMKVNMLCLRGPFEKEKDIKLFRKFKADGIKFVGCSSYLSFPSKCNNPSQTFEGGVCHETPMIDGQRIDTLVDGWLHCFRSDTHINNNNKLLLSESDFMDSIAYLRDFDISKKQYEYDFICYCPIDPAGCNDGWHFYNKNWPLSKKTIEIMCNDFNMQGLLIGRDNCPLEINDQSKLKKVKWLEYNQFIRALANSKLTIIASSEDASPRTLSESLLVNTPILVNEGILGGWKYVTRDTGLFYSMDNIKEKIQEILYNINNNLYSPRQHYISNYGLYNSGKILRDFLVNINPELSRHKYIKFAVS